MSSFTEPFNELQLKPKGDGKTFILTEEYSFYLTENHNRIIRVPEGFESDGASVPKMFQWLIPRWGTHGKAAVLHDYLYRNRLVKRDRADKIMLDAMIILEVPKWKRQAIYRSVRLFGWCVYFQVRKKLKKIFTLDFL
jgi:hypothetical protein